MAEVPFLLWTQVGPRDHLLDGGHIPHRKGCFRGTYSNLSLPFDILDIICKMAGAMWPLATNTVTTCC